MINGVRDAQLELAEARWREALGKGEDERDELQGRLQFHLAQVRELRWVRGSGAVRLGEAGRLGGVLGGVRSHWGTMGRLRECQAAEAHSMTASANARLLREEMKGMRKIPKERQAAAQTGQELLEALKPQTDTTAAQTDPVPELQRPRGAEQQQQLQEQQQQQQQQEQQQREQQALEAAARKAASEHAGGFSELGLSTSHRPTVRSRAWALKCVVQVRGRKPRLACGRSAEA
jgi:hypothetical protein